MSFLPNIPQATDRPSRSQSDLLNNFTQLNTTFDVDHVTFNAASDRGEHNKITLNSVIADPGLADPKCSIYTKTVAGDSELFFEKYDNAAVANLVQQMTNLTVANGIRHGGNQYTWLSPWGMRFTSGITGAFTGTSAANYITAFTTVIYCVVATPTNVGNREISATSTLTQLTLQGPSGSAISASYLVIGV